MVATARTPPRQKKMVDVLNPVLLRETLKKVDECMGRLQELEYTVAGGTKVVSGVSLSPRSTRGYLRTSLRCKQESVRIKNSAPRTSPLGKFPRPTNLGGEWRQMSLPTMLVGETVVEILQASQFAREIVSTVGRKFASQQDPKTPPVSQGSNQKVDPENTDELRARRRKEKQTKQQYDSPPLQRARSRINFPSKVREFDHREKENNKKYLANRVSPRNRPWGSKTVLFPNPLFLSSTTHSSSSRQQQLCKTRSRNRGTTTTPHKFLIKSPPPSSSSPSKFQVKVKSPPRVVSISSPTLKSKKSVTVHKGDGLVCLSNKSSPKRSSAASKLCRSFSPSRLATRLVSPLKSKKTVQKRDGLVVRGLKQRPASSTVQIIPAPPPPRIFNNIL